MRHLISLDSPQALEAPAALAEIVRRALAEDLGDGDVTTNCTVPPEARLRGEFLAKQNGVIAGLEAANVTFASLDPDSLFTAHAAEGSRVAAGQVVATV